MSQQPQPFSSPAMGQKAMSESMHTSDSSPLPTQRPPTQSPSPVGGMGYSQGFSAYSPISSFSSKFSTPHSAAWRSPHQLDDPQSLIRLAASHTPSSHSPLPSRTPLSHQPPLSSLSVPDGIDGISRSASRYSPVRQSSMQSHYHSNRKHQQQSGLTLPPPQQQQAIVLSKEDQEAVRQLLDAQTELLQASKEQVLHLERRLAELQAVGR
jgi:hypothetical protein